MEIKVDDFGVEEDHNTVEYKLFRDYFEVGCLCILNGTIQKMGVECSDEDAVGFYSQECKCSRHPERGRLVLLRTTGVENGQDGANAASSSHITSNETRCL